MAVRFVQIDCAREVALHAGPKVSISEGALSGRALSILHNGSAECHVQIARAWYTCAHMHWLGRHRLLVLAVICFFWTGLIFLGHFFPGHAVSLGALARRTEL